MEASVSVGRRIAAAEARQQGLRLCEVCGEHVRPIRPEVGWKIAVGAAYCSLPAMVGLCAMSGLMMTVMVPYAGLIAVGMLGPLHEKAFATPRCPQCRRYVYD